MFSGCVYKDVTKLTPSNVCSITAPQKNGCIIYYRFIINYDKLLEMFDTEEFKTQFDDDVFIFKVFYVY